jgi:hypothetical protein
MYALILMAWSGPAVAQTDPREIIDRVDRILRGNSSHGVAEMLVVTDRWSRTKSLEIWSEGTENVLIRILAPKKEEGVATLKIGTDIWNYLPKISRTIRIPSSMMMASWMGSHFTNDDLVKESRLIEDYNIEVGFEGERDGEEVWEFELIPLPDAPVVWGKITYQVRKSDTMPLKALYYDESGELKRYAVFSDFRTMGGRKVPAKMTLRPTDKTEEYTRISYQELEFDIELPKNIFSLSSLRNRR